MRRRIPGSAPDPVTDLAIIRSHRFGAMEAALAGRLSQVFGAGQVILAVDESRGPVDCGGLAKVSLTPATLAGLGFAGLPADWGWRCGDLCYHAAAAARPPHARYWLFEADIWLPPVAEALCALSALPQEALAAGLGPKATAPKYSRLMTPLCGSDRWGCFFPVTRVSARLLGEMRRLRERSLAEIAPHRPAFPNDEAILGGAVHATGVSHADLYAAAPRFFDPACFATNPPHLRDALDRGTEGRVFHPAIPLSAILDEIARNGPGAGRRYDAHRLRRVLKEAAPDEAARIRAALS